MTARSKDLRPKVISFPTPLNRLNIASTQKDILWPCHAFSVSIPQKKKSSLNIFEETVLKLTEIESGDTDKIAGITCLDKELVSFIQSRLNQLELVDDRYIISKAGLALLDSWRDSSDGNVEYVVGTVFVDLLIGKLLPYVHIGDLKKETISSIGNENITLEMESKGKSKTVKCIKISPSNSRFWEIAPESKDIIKAIRDFRKNYKRHALLNQNNNQYPPPIPVAEAISIQAEPELVYLHCLAFIQRGNSDLLVTDGLGYGFSESFASYLIDQNSKWVIDLKGKGVIDQVHLHREPVDSHKGQNEWKYPQVTRLINETKKVKGIKTLLNELGHLPKTEAEQKDYIYKRQQIASRLHATLEWALRYAIANYPIPEWERIFISQNHKENERILCKFAEKIGFSVSETNRSILQVKAGALRQIECGKVELQPLLAIAITGAAIKYTNHPFHALAMNHSGFLGYAIQLKRLRDPVEHGDISDFEADLETLKNIVQRSVEVIIKLLPSIASELEEGNSSATNLKEDVNQERLKAEIELDKALGMAFVSKMTPDIKEQLIRSQIMLLKYTDENAIEIIKCLSSVMQMAFFEVLIDRKWSGNIDSDTKDAAIKKIVECGFYTCVDDIPEQIITVNAKRIHRATQGSSTTLGAHLLAIFFLCKEKDLIDLKNADSAIIDFVANLIALRGHGNNQRHSFSINDLESLKNNVFKAIKIITEIF